MTTDAFTEAAEVASWEDDRHPDDTGAWSRMKFMRGARWARAHLAAQEPTDAEVLAALNAQGVVVSPKMHPAPSLDYWGDKPAEAMRAALTAAEHRATRAEAQSAIRGRAVLIYQQRARQAEAERDEWRETALDERGAALDLLEQIKVRDKRIQAVQHLVDQADHAGDWTVTCSRLQRAIDQ